MSNWLSPLNRMRIRAAVLCRATTVVLDDNRVFFLSYGNGLAYLRPQRGLTPQGHFKISQIESKTWVGDMKS